MAERFFGLSTAERTEAFQVASTRSGRPLHILEKDVYVVWALSSIFDSPFGKHLVFKGGTSLSKAYAAIERFSEDIDVTYDIRAIAPDLVEGAGDEPLPKTRAQGRKWTDAIRERLPKWLGEVVIPHLKGRIDAEKLEATARADDEGNIYIDYLTKADGYGYVAPRIRIEFGARSTGEPAQSHDLTCDAARYLDLVFPTASARVMCVERTIWEKATAIHVFCHQGIKDRLARHWYDVARLDLLGHVDAALADRQLARRVADHKALFFSAKDAQGQSIDYGAAVTGGLVLVPTGVVLEALAADYGKMIEDRLFLREPETFNWIIARCQEIQTRANV